MCTYKHYGNKYAYTNGLGKAKMLSKLLCLSRYFKTTVKYSIRAVSNYMHMHTPNAHKHTCTVHTDKQTHAQTDKQTQRHTHIHTHTCTVHIAHLIF